MHRAADAVQVMLIEKQIRNRVSPFMA